MGRNRKKKVTSSKVKIWYVGLYIRLSKEDEMKRTDLTDQSRSVENQQKILRDHVESLEDEYNKIIVVEVFIDDGNTGTDTQRPEFQRMKEYIREGKINCVIVKSLARAFRNLGDQTKHLEEFFPMYDVRFINSGTPYIDSYCNPKSVTSMEVPINGMFNEQFAAQTSEEVRKTFNAMRKRGEFIGAFAPYGWKKDIDNKNKLLLDEEAAKVIYDICKWFLYGKGDTKNENGEIIAGTSLSINGIARELNELGIPCPSNYKKLNGMKYYNPHNKFGDVYWNTSTIRRILADQNNIGNLVQGKFRIKSYKLHKQIQVPEDEWFIAEGAIPPIIEKRWYDEIQKRLERDTRAGDGKKELYLLSGFLKCGECGRALHRRASRGIAYNYCRLNQTANNVCSKPSIREDILIKSILIAIQTQIKLIDSLEEIIDKINQAPQINKQSNRLNTLLKNQEAELIKTQKLSDSLYINLMEELITKDDYMRMKSDFTSKIDGLQKSIEKVKDDYAVIANGITTEHSYFKQFKEYHNIKELHRDVLIALVDSVIVHKSGEITIKFNFADQYQRILDFIENNKRELVLVKGNQIA